MKYEVFNPFRSPYDKGEINTGVSMAIPDQSMTIQEILSRHARGLNLGGLRVPIYEEEGLEGMPDVSKMDLADRQTYFESVQDEINNTKKLFTENENRRKREMEEKKRKENLDTGNVVSPGEPKPAP